MKVLKFLEIQPSHGRFNVYQRGGLLESARPSGRFFDWFGFNFALGNNLLINFKSLSDYVDKFQVTNQLNFFSPVNLANNKHALYFESIMKIGEKLVEIL